MLGYVAEGLGQGMRRFITDDYAIEKDWRSLVSFEQKAALVSRIRLTVSDVSRKGLRCIFELENELKRELRV